MVEGTCLENKRLFTGSASSNLALSALGISLATAFGGVPLEAGKTILVVYVSGVYFEKRNTDKVLYWA